MLRTKVIKRNAYHTVHFKVRHFMNCLQTGRISSYLFILMLTRLEVSQVNQAPGQDLYAP